MVLTSFGAVTKRSLLKVMPSLIEASVVSLVRAIPPSSPR